MLSLFGIFVYRWESTRLAIDTFGRHPRSEVMKAQRMAFVFSSMILPSKPQGLSWLDVLCVVQSGSKATCWVPERPIYSLLFRCIVGFHSGTRCLTHSMGFLWKTMMCSLLQKPNCRLNLCRNKEKLKTFKRNQTCLIPQSYPISKSTERFFV